MGGVASEGAVSYLAVVLQSKVEGKAGDTFRLGPSGDLQTLNNSRETLVLKTGVFSLSVLTDDGEVDVVVTGWEAGEGLAQND